MPLGPLPGEEACLDPAARTGVALFRLDVERLDDDRLVGEVPAAFSRETDLAVARQTEPALLAGPVGPEHGMERHTESGPAPSRVP